MVLRYAYPDFEDDTEENHHRNKKQHQEPISLLLFLQAISLNTYKRESQFFHGDHLGKAHN